MPTYQKISANEKIQAVMSGNATAGKALKWVDMRDFQNFAVVLIAAALTGAGLTAFKIQASKLSDGSNPVDVVTRTMGTNPDAVGDMVFLEVVAEQIQQALDGGRFVSAVITTANAADSYAATYIQERPRFPQAGLTADIIS